MQHNCDSAIFAHQGKIMIFVARQKLFLNGKTQIIGLYIMESY